MVGKIVPILFLAVLLPGCRVDQAIAEPALIDRDKTIDREQFDAVVPGLLEQYRVAGVGIGIIRKGELVWTGYYGEQGPGIPVTDQTVFNTASVAKTVTAETIITLAAKGLIDLDEPIATYVQHRHLKEDARYKLLTPRILLTHRSGLLNWAHEYENNRLAFVHDPDTRYSYSGAGIQLAAEYAEAKLGKDFEALAFEHVLTPLGIEELSMGRRRPWMRNRLATPMDENGRYRRATRLNPGLRRNAWQASDDLLFTIEAYARFLSGVIKSDGLSAEWIEQRAALETTFDGDPIWGCEPEMNIRCPDNYGHGIGWQVYRYGDQTVLKHSGNDAGENAVVYLSPETGDGAVIAVNGANGWFVSTRIMELIGDQPFVTAYYRALIEKHLRVDFPPLNSSNP